MLKEILKEDAANNNFFKEFRRASISTQVDEDEIDPALLGLLASFMPILGDISDQCRTQTRQWLSSLVSFKLGKPIWPVKSNNYFSKPFKSKHYLALIFSD